MTGGDFHLVFAEPFDADATAKARAAGRVTVVDGGDAASLRGALADGDALLVRTTTAVTRDLIQQAPRLRVIGRGGVGLENIDLTAARERGIAVVYTPGAATEAVADLTVGMMLALVRRLPWYDEMVRAGRFAEARGETLRELGEMTVGIVGFGRIGRAVGRRCALGFGASVVFNDIIRVPPTDFPATPVEKGELLGRADVVTLHVPLTDATRGMIDAQALAGFKPGAILINTSRGAVVDTAAVAEALRAGRLGGGGFDVFCDEPPRADDPILSAPHTVLTPHIGARTYSGLSNMNRVVDDVLRVLRGEPPHHPA